MPKPSVLQSLHSHYAGSPDAWRKFLQCWRKKNSMLEPAAHQWRNLYSEKSQSEIDSILADGGLLPRLEKSFAGKLPSSYIDFMRATGGHFVIGSLPAEFSKSTRANGFYGLRDIGYFSELLPVAAKMARENGVPVGDDQYNLYVDSARNAVSCAELGKISSLEHLVLINVGGSSNCHFVSGLKRLQFLGVTGMPVDQNWEMLIKLKALMKITMLVDDEHSPNEEIVRKAASSAGKRVVSLERSGKKKQPLVHFEFEESK